MSDIKVLLEVTREQQIEIEDICFSRGISISQYFLGLHEASKIAHAPVQEQAPVEAQEAVEEEKIASKPNKKSKTKV